MSNFKDQQIKLNESSSLITYLVEEKKLNEKEINSISAYQRILASNGIGFGDKVAILSNTRQEWIHADLAILSMGAISVSIYQSMTPHEIAFILHDSDSKFIFAENQEQIEKLDLIFSGSWQIPKIEDREEKEIEISTLPVCVFEDATSTLINPTKIELLKSNSKLDVNSEIKRENLASIVYTSGTTGPPKGVMQTHGNHLSNVRQVLESGLMLEEGSIFLFLPLAHSFARLMAYISLCSNLKLSLPSVHSKTHSKIDTGRLGQDLTSANANIFPVVPRFLEKIQDHLEALARKKSLSAALLSLTFSVSLNAYQSGNPFSKLLSKLLTPIKQKITKRVFGSNFSYCVSGGAKLPDKVHIFFESIGITILQGYGLTETCVATNACRLNDVRIGSVGPVLASDIEMKIIDGDEIAFRGPNNAIGYLNRPNATKESWTEDGWFLTGDQGRIDEDGFLYITGRKKELIATSGGKKIAPLPIEEKILEHKIFSQAVIVGEGRKYLSVILTLNNERISSNLGKNFDQLSKQEIENHVLKYLAKINENLASYESLKKFLISAEEFTPENGLMTASMKIKRKEVEKRFQAEIDTLYNN